MSYSPSENGLIVSLSLPKASIHLHAYTCIHTHVSIHIYTAIEKLMQMLFQEILTGERFPIIKNAVSVESNKNAILFVAPI